MKILRKKSEVKISKLIAANWFICVKTDWNDPKSRAESLMKLIENNLSISSCLGADNLVDVKVFYDMLDAKIKDR